ncbi:hypothetical protein B6N60_04760 [Richelia sinica FACHB-800]|uniref:Uncharacterized protein n=1 Tax=Richelia sinica FACHB-800 TaxID=1357546 RepID=A0A975TDF5_9NOST|nr:hypothetical protein B6N60_04760 [Richelia sinica FACHB-800]
MNCRIDAHLSHPLGKIIFCLQSVNIFNPKETGELWRV